MLKVAMHSGHIIEPSHFETVLRESETRFRQLADALPLIVWMARPDGHLDYFNERWYDFTGHRRDVSGDESWTPVLHPDDVERCVARWYASVRSGAPHQIEYRLFNRRTGDYRWHLGRAMPMRALDGSIIRWFGTSTDIHDQKRSEETSRFLAKASAVLARVVDTEVTLQTVARLAVPDFADWCVVDLVADNGDIRRVAVAHSDPAKVELLHRITEKYPPREVNMRGLKGVIETGEPELVPVITEELIAEATHDDEHYRLASGLGLKSYITVPLGVGGRTLGAITFATAESDRRYGKADLTLAHDLAHRASIAIDNARLYSELREADRQKDEFLAVLAHELRNPLAPIRTAVQLLKIAGDAPAVVARTRAVLERQVEQMVRLIDDLLDVSRITRGKIELRKQTGELVPIIQAALETSRPVVEAAGHELTVTIAPEPVFVHADETRLAQVFSNLLNNAAKYTPRGGRIRLIAERAGDRIAVRVCDTGVGVPRDMQARIFDMFAQVDRSLEKTQGGLGIGLTLVKKLVEMHGGTVEVRSEGAGTGSEFVVYLPVVPAPRKPHAASDAMGPAPARVRPLRVLVVDDNRDAADSLAELLRISGHEAQTANDGSEAVQAAATQRFDAVLLDIGMPRLNGFEAARRIREQAGPHGPVLIAITGWGQDADRRRSSEMGFSHHFCKPVDAVELERVLSTVPLR